MPILCDNRGYYVAWINNAEFANTDADGDFMAHARQDIPYLMKDNAQLRSALSAARAEGEAVAETRARVIAAEMLQPALKSWKEKVAGLQSQLKEASAEGERLKGLNESYLDRASRVLNKEMDERNDLVAELIDEAERLRSQLTTAQEKVKRLEEEKESLGQCATKNCDCTIDVVYCTKCRKDWES